LRAVQIGWFQHSEEGRELGPFALAEMRRRWAAGELDRDSLVRHSLEARHRYAGDVPEIWGEEQGQAPVCACLRHPKRPAVRFCLCCWAPICAGCQIRERNCRRCHQGLYDRRLLAGIVDLVLIPVLILVPDILLIPSRSRETGPYYFEYIFLTSYTLLLIWFVLLKDWWGSPGKWLLGLRVVDLESREPCGLLASLQRNFLLPLILVSAFYFSYSSWSVYGIWTCLLISLTEKGLAYRDAMLRRPSEYWAGTRVLRTPEGVRWRRVDTRRRLAKLGLKIDYPGSRPDQPGSPPSCAAKGLRHPFDRPEPRPDGRPGGAGPEPEATGSIAETDESIAGHAG
jgi:uncharacterized RDD family membrane protein YckC